MLAMAGFKGLPSFHCLESRRIPMPFDGTDFSRRQQLLDKLDLVVRLLDSEDKWCKHQFLSWGGKRCILAALFLTHSRHLLAPVILAAARDITGTRFTRIDNFNDDPATDYALVTTVLDRVHERILTGHIPPVGQRRPLLSKIGVVWYMRRYWLGRRDSGARPTRM
jgi:hypothetical protein